MKKILFICCTLFLLMSCAKKSPEFVKVDNIKVISLDIAKVTLGADAFFKNPNIIGGKIETDSIQVWVNDEMLANVLSEPFRVPARKEFKVPLKVEIPAKHLLGLNKKGGFLEGLINSVLSNSVKVQYKGDIRYRVLGFSRTYKLDKTQTVKLK